MKHLLTAIACFFALSMSAQTPYNPDSDGDNLIGITDVLDFLPYFGSEFFPESSDSILIYDMQPEIDAYNELYPWGGGPNATITIPATADKVVMVSTNQDNCTQNDYCARVNLLIEDSYLYDEVTVIWVSTEHYPHNLWPDQYGWQGVHFTMINTESGWLKPMTD